MPAQLFISYRRTDSQQAAFGLYAQLRARIGAGSVFMDRSGISAGELWSQRLRDALDSATVVLCLMGPSWLRCADEYGRRRLDDPDDWVRTELSSAITSGKPVIPVLFGASNSIPAAQALPPSLLALSSYQAYALRDDHWDSDLNGLIQLLVETYGFKETEQKVALPDPVVSERTLSQVELDAELRLLPRWEAVESLLPGDYPRSRQEIRRVYSFRSFTSAMRFMTLATVPIRQLQHHPRWENQWRIVKVFLSTWDIGYRVSRLDIQLAKALDAVYEEMQQSKVASTPASES